MEARSGDDAGMAMREAAGTDAGVPSYAAAAAAAPGAVVATAAVGVPAAAAAVRLGLLAENGMPPAGSGAMVEVLVGGLNLRTITPSPFCTAHAGCCCLLHAA